MENLTALLNASSSAIAMKKPEMISDLEAVQPPLLEELLYLLNHKNGFYAFESALHVFPITEPDDPFGLERWNAAELWKNSFEGLAEGYLCFAQDIFGVQFCIRDGGVYSFDPEIAETVFLASSLDEWAAMIMADYDFLCGYPIARLWQEQHGALPLNCRLVPKTPFFGGGEFAVENLKMVACDEGMRLRGPVASQLKNIPDGAAVQFRTSD